MRKLFLAIPTEDGDPTAQTPGLVFLNRKKWYEPNAETARVWREVYPYGDLWDMPESTDNALTDEQAQEGPCYLCERNGVTPPTMGVLIVGRQLSKRTRCEFAARGYVCTRHLADFSVFQQIG